LHRLLVDERLRTTDLVVLSPRSSGKSAVFAAKRFGNIQLVEWTAEPLPNTVRFATPQRFKGLEANAVVLCEVDRQHTSSSPANLYVAASRARHLLVVAGYQRA
jgi:DNA helicase IV